MKPTERDIRAELIEGWEIVEWFAPNEADGLRFVRIGKSNLVAVFYTKLSFDNMNIAHCCFNDDIDIEIQYPDFLAGNYDLSDISQNYEPEEWQRIISMCERIVCLITGEQTLEEKVREKLSGRKYVCLEVSTNEVSYRTNGILYVITNDKFKIWHEGKREPIVHDISVFMGLCAYGQDYRKMICDIAALLTPSDQPEQTLEEAVRGHIDCLEYMPAYSVHEDHAVIKYEPKGTYEIYADKVVVDCGPWSGEYLLDEFDDSTFNDDLREAVLNIAKLYSTRSTKPSYSDLEQRVEELDERLQEMTCWRDNLAKELHAQNRKVEELERENASLLDKFGPIDQAEQQVAAVETRFQKLAKRAERIADLLIQLNEEIL